MWSRDIRPSWALPRGSAPGTEMTPALQLASTNCCSPWPLLGKLWQQQSVRTCHRLEVCRRGLLGASNLDAVARPLLGLDRDSGGEQARGFRDWAPRREEARPGWAVQEAQIFQLQSQQSPQITTAAPCHGLFFLSSASDMPRTLIKGRVCFPYPALLRKECTLIKQPSARCQSQTYSVSVDSLHP